MSGRFYMRDALCLPRVDSLSELPPGLRVYCGGREFLSAREAIVRRWKQTRWPPTPASRLVVRGFHEPLHTRV